MKCFNCNSSTHGFKHCPQVARYCQKCRTYGHPERRCRELHTVCWYCAEEGNIHKGICKEHRQIKSCGVMIVDQEENIFCVLSKDARIWSLPKGHQNTTKEPYHKCAMREVYEETNIKLNIPEDSKYFCYQKRRYFVIKIKNSMKRFMNIKLDHKEVAAYRWIHHTQLDQVHTNADLQYIKNNFYDIIES